jgi:hypothetical protein
MKERRIQILVAMKKFLKEKGRKKWNETKLDLFGYYYIFIKC